MQLAGKYEHFAPLDVLFAGKYEHFAGSDVLFAGKKVLSAYINE